MVTILPLTILALLKGPVFFLPLPPLPRDPISPHFPKPLHSGLGARGCDPFVAEPLPHQLRDRTIPLAWAGLSWLRELFMARETSPGKVVALHAVHAKWEFAIFTKGVSPARLAALFLA